MSANAEVRAEAVLRRVRRVTHPQGVEVGVLRAGMSVVLLQGHLGLQLLLVDSWAPKEQQPVPYQETGDVHAYLSVQEQQRNQAVARRCMIPYRSRCLFQVGSSIEVAAGCLRAHYHFVFLDADHSYEGVRDDIAAWWPTIRPGGWLCGHDYDGFLWEADPQTGEQRKHFFGVTKAVDEWVKREKLHLVLDADNTWFVQKGTV